MAIETPDGVVDKDGCIRADTTPESLAALKAAFLAEGTVTAGTAVPADRRFIRHPRHVSEEFARAHGLRVLARIKSIAVSGCDPTIMGYGPVPRPGRR